MQVVQLKEQGAESKATTKALERVTEGIAKCKKAVILVGAGISTSAGIPDFRSKDVGLYSSNSTASTSTATLKGPAMFSASVYSSSTTTAQHLEFLSAFKDSLDLITRNPPTATHGLMGLLKKRGQLRRVYTQNIDNLEERAGLKAVEIEGVKLKKCREVVAVDIKGKGKAKLEGDYIQLHGSIYRVRCSSCDYVAEWTDDAEKDQSEGVGRVFRRGEVAECPQCSTRAAIRAAQRKRSLPSRSFLRPAITLYEENSPAALSIGAISLSDLAGGPDLMIVMGTSLKIPGFKKLVKEFGKAVKAKGGLRILVNREEIKGQEWRDVFDYNIVGNSETFTNRIMADWKRTRPRDWVRQQATLLDSFSTSSKKQLSSASSKPKSDASPRPPLRSISSNTILPPLPPTTIPTHKEYKIVSNNPWSTVEYLSERPTKRSKPNPSPVKTRTTRTAKAAATPLSVPDLSFSSSSPFSSSSSSNEFSTSTPPHLQVQSHSRDSLSPTSPLYHQHHPAAFKTISPIKHSSYFSHSNPIKPTSSLFHLLNQPFKPPLLHHHSHSSRPSLTLSMISDSRTPSPCPEVHFSSAPISPEF
ncbi:hypothetical protein JCM3765_003880 [Sporobolomyces pararoseus]